MKFFGLGRCRSDLLIVWVNNQLSTCSKRLLVIAKSARMLAQLGVDQGYEVAAVDCFADSDTQQLAAPVMKVSTLALSDVKPALERVDQEFSISKVIYGSGFEGFPETLAYLEKNWPVSGNSTVTFKRLLDKRDFFRQLGELSIPHPKVEFDLPAENGDWLWKPLRGEGGLGIRRYKPVANHSGGYWQLYQPGKAMSVLFIVSHVGVELIGFNEQWTQESTNGQSFLFAGIMSNILLPDPVRDLVMSWAVKLASVYKLVGLNSMDFIFHEGACYVLEINARISASAQLYGKTVLSKHLEACAGRISSALEPSRRIRAYQIFYAQRQLEILPNIAWPEWVVDRPNAGAIVRTGEPICSIIAAGKNSGKVRKILDRQQRTLKNLLEIGL